MNDLVVAIYDIAAFAGTLFLMFVIRQAINDLHIKRTDPLSVQNARKIAFFAAASFLMLSVCFQNYWLVHPSLVPVGLVATGLVVGAIAILAVNVISLHLRAPGNGHKIRISSVIGMAARKMGLHW